MTSPSPNVPYTASDLKLLEDTLFELRRHGYKATRVVLPGVLELELVPVGDDPGEPVGPRQPGRKTPSEVRASRRHVVGQMIHDLDETE